MPSVSPSETPSESGEPFAAPSNLSKSAKTKAGKTTKAGKATMSNTNAGNEKVEENYDVQGAFPVTTFDGMSLPADSSMPF